MEILGVRIDNYTKEETLQKVESFFDLPGQYKIFTPNPEMLVLSQKFSFFKDVLNRGDLNLCDGFGITLVSGGAVKRFPGADFVWDLCRIAAVKKRKVFLLGGCNMEILTRTADVLRKKFADLQIVGMNPGPLIKNSDSGIIEVDEQENDLVVESVNASSAEVLVVAFGQIKQEEWIDKYLPLMPKIKVAVGVGGTFNFISGEVRRAPLFLRRIGLEWLYRLVRQPKRFRRIFRATIEFIYFNFQSLWKDQKLGK